MALLEVKNLSVDFVTENGAVQAVKDISFSLEKGKTIGIVGESGSGKSVTSLALMGLLPKGISKISHGQAVFQTENETVDLFTLPEKKICKYRGNHIAMIFQEPMTSLNPVYKCGRQVVEAIRIHEKLDKKTAKQKALHWFAEVLLPDPEKAFNSYPHELSGGQRQRVMIAMAMSCHPALLIADEPTTALDVTVQKNILELMKRLQQKYGMSIIFISHDLGVIAEIADTVIVMYRGNVVEQGLVADIFKDPQQGYTKGLLACRPKLDVRLRSLPTVEQFLQDKSEGSSEIVGEAERKAAHGVLYSQAPLLDVDHIKTYFPLHKAWFSSKPKVFKAVDDVSLKLFPGETLGLVGESGCGKTTLGRTIIKLVEPTDGKIVFLGNDISGYSRRKMRDLRKDIQIIFQDPYSSLNPRITVGKAIVEAMKMHCIGESAKERKILTQALLKEVNLDETYFNRYPHELSGGQRQRICIARALALKPKFVICDESVSALDVSVQAQVLNLLNHLKKEFQFSMIFISHDMSVVKYMADRMMVMKNGKIVEYGDPDDICQAPATDYTRQLLNSIPKGL
ncbi:MAG: ABC transporter ATP-binding protein [Bacteroidota bacterium]